MEALLAAAIIGVCFYLLAVVAEHYFVPAIDILAKKLKLSSDASGATLLAMGSSAPEFFTSLFAVLAITGSNHADVGAGTIVGSAIFNVLVIVGASSLYKAVKLQWQPVIRDMIFYVFTILLLLWAFWDGSISLFEAVVFVVTYVLYVVLVVNWRKLFSYKDVPAPDEEADLPSKGFSGAVHKLVQIILPSPSKKPKLYLWTFIGSILAIAGLSWVLVEQAVHLADILNVNATFVALTVLAAGTSVPDLIGSMVVAKQGRGDMAVSNAVGSNIFDVLFGLGFPWLVVLLYRGGAIEVARENLISSVILLFATVVAILFLLVARNWRLGRRSGLALIGLYVGYCIYIASQVI